MCTNSWHCGPTPFGPAPLFRSKTKGELLMTKSPDDASESTDTESARAQIRGSTTRRRLAALALATALGAAGYEGWLLFQQHQVNAAAAAALDAAKAFTLNLTTVDPNRIDQSFTAVNNGATGDFKQLYTAAGGQLRRALVENKAAAQGTVIDAAVKTATKDTVQVILFVDQSVRNATTPTPQLDRSRVTVTMQDANGRWLASKVDLS